MVRAIRVLLDANVLVDAQVRDLLCRLAEAELIDVRWSETIIDEVKRALATSLGRRSADVDRLIGALNAAFPLATVEGYERLVDEISLPDPDDRHVVAAAIHGECDLLVTDNIRDFPAAVIEQFDSSDLLVLSVDEALREFALLFRGDMARSSTLKCRRYAVRHRPWRPSWSASRAGLRRVRRQSGMPWVFLPSRRSSRRCRTLRANPGHRTQSGA